MAATDGAQYTDTYSTAHPGYSPQAGTVATFVFSGLGNGWTEGAMIFDLADFQASTFGAFKVTYNGIVQDWAFNDGYPHTKIHAFNFQQNVIDSINSLGSLTIVIDRNGSGDFYGVDYAKLSNLFVPDVPEPATWAMLAVGFGLVGSAMRRRQRRRVQFA
ncbi:MAG: PEPxxWA-CTERM sorting domain-containing protein [Sphingobium sp.]|nr:PEPxxWA-CTERM sorting domain-containing protein [Sphingobium sp.]